MAQVVSYLPKFYFGSLLLLFGVEILSDWLLKSWKKVTRKEYGLLLATFAAVMIGEPSVMPDENLGDSVLCPAWQASKTGS